MIHALEKCQSHETHTLRDCHRLEDTKKTWQLNAMWNLRLNPRREKDINGKTCKNQIKSVD